MKRPPVNLSPLQKDYAVYLPAISSFYTKQLEKVLPKPLAKQISKKVGKGVESITSKAIDLWNKFSK